MAPAVAAPKGTSERFQGNHKERIMHRLSRHQGVANPLASEIVTFAKNGQFPSDHLPVLTRFEL